MRVLVACEFSGRIREAFNAKGHFAISCDLLETEIPGNHYQGDVRNIIWKHEWDLIIAHPPCTYLARSGVRWLHEDPTKERWNKMLEAIDFFNIFLEHHCLKVCIENPIMHKYAKSRLKVFNYTQKTQPYFHGHPEKKSTCLWLKGLPLLKASKNVSHEMIGKHPGDVGFSHYVPDSKNRAKERSRTYLGIAAAMADQWG
jgi:hypothetical protein